MKIEVIHHALDQAQIMVEGRRVGYICYGGAEMPINYLPKACVGVQLTTEERIEVAKYVRGVMPELTAKYKGDQQELETLISGKPQETAKVEHDTELEE